MYGVTGSTPPCRMAAKDHTAVQRSVYLQMNSKLTLCGGEHHTVWLMSGCIVFSSSRASLHEILWKLSTQATVGGSPFGPSISVARGHSRE